MLTATRQSAAAVEVATAHTSAQVAILGDKLSERGKDKLTSRQEGGIDISWLLLLNTNTHTHLIEKHTALAMQIHYWW